jgi:glycosyltransferase involved in cell wall biosynthesis
LPKILKVEKADLAHFPHFNAPYFCKTPYVVTIHDTILFDHPSRRASTLSWPLYQAKYWTFKHHFSRVARKASAILTVSDYSRSRISHYVPEAKGKITVTRIAPSSQLSIPAVTTKPGSTQSPYLLYVGNAYPHKNLEFLIHGFYKIWLQRNDLSLVLVGKLDYFYERLKERSHQLDWKGKACPVRFFGYATEKQLSDLYANATLYVFPSLDEGFGIPPLEAMQLGVPVLSSSAASMPEVLGDAAMYFDPTNENEFCAKITDLLQDEVKRAELVQKGREQAAKYSWSLCAQQTAAVYQRILRKPL